MSIGYDDVVKTWNSWGVRSIADLDKYLDSFKVLFVYNSGKMENDKITYNDTREIFDKGGVSNYTGNLRALFEQQNQKMCYEVLVDRVDDRLPLSIELIKEFHAILTGGTYDTRRYIDNGERPGSFKKHGYVTGINEVGSEPECVEDDLVELIKEVNEIGSRAPLRAGAYLHARFENIHPFADGNGRTGRMLLNYWLLLNNHPPVILFEEDRRQYYKALQAYDETEEIDTLTEFLKEQAVKTWQKAMSRSGQDRKKGLPDLI